MKKISKLCSTILVIVLLLSMLTACGSTKETTVSNNSVDTESTDSGKEYNNS